MRPVRRNKSPRTSEFDDYSQAQAELISRLGSYCSYCERRIATLLAVEHIQPKNLPAYAHLRGRWENFLLACVNCNSTKTNKDVNLAQVLLPDRDNTFAAYDYTEDGKVFVKPDLGAAVRDAALATLSLVGLDKQMSRVEDANGKMVAIDRVAQRMEAWLIAQESKSDIEADPTNDALRRASVRTATQSGFFSIWMTVFDGDTDMKQRLVRAFAGTEPSGCFHPTTTVPVSPAPNPDGLSQGGKI